MQDRDWRQVSNMPKEMGRYDTSLQMFVEEPRDPSVNHLRFQRWLKDTGRAGALPFSAPRGDYVFKLTDPEIVAHVARESRLKKELVFNRPSRLEHMAEHGED